MDDKLSLPGGLERSFEKISPTALLTAHGRSFSDIPFASEMYIELARRKGGDTFDAGRYLAPRLESRHLLTDDALFHTGSTQILEVAAGFSTRGLAWVSRNFRRGKYVEFDLPDVIETKRTVIRFIEPTALGHLYLCRGDALEANDMAKAARILHPQLQRAVITEGLMMYLTQEERIKLAENVKAALERSGGVWITSDVMIKKMLEEDEIYSPGKMERIRTETQSDINANAFDNVGEATEFFTSLGFDVQVRYFSEVAGRLRSPARLGIDAQEVQRINRHSTVFVMRPTSN